MCEVCVNAHFGQLHLNAHHPLLKLFLGCTCHMQRKRDAKDGGDHHAAASAASAASTAAAAAAPGDQMGGVWAGAPGGGGVMVAAAAAAAAAPGDQMGGVWAGAPGGGRGGGVSKSSRFRGVSWNKGAKKWMVQIRVDGKTKTIGYFADEVNAAHAYDAYAIANGIDAPRNFHTFTAPDLPVATLTRYSGPVLCVAFIPPVEDADGPTKVRFVTGSHDNTVKVWVEQDGAWSVEATLTGHSKNVWCVAVLADGRLVTGSSDNTVKVWKENTLGTWSVEATLRGHGGSVYCVAVLADASTGEPRFVIGSSDKTAKVWKEQGSTWSVEATLTGHGSYVRCVAVLADGRLATGSDDNTVKVWKESSPGSGVWSIEATLTGHRSDVDCVAVLADGRLVTGSEDFTVKVWKESSPGSGVWSVEATLTGHGGSVNGVAVLEDDVDLHTPLFPNLVPVRFATGSADATVKVWKESWPGSGVWSVEATLTAPGYVFCVTVLPPLRSNSLDEVRLAAGGAVAAGGGDVRVWG